MKLTEILSVSDVVDMTAKVLNKQTDLIIPGEITTGPTTVWFKTIKGLLGAVIVNNEVGSFTLHIRGAKEWFKVERFDDILGLIEALREINKDPSGWLKANDTSRSKR